MPFYPRLKRSRIDSQIKKRTAKNLIKLKKQLSSELPLKDLDQTVLIATWNIRDLGKNGAKHGRRTIEDLFYIAEIISRFDIIAVQEINDLKDWEDIMDILGHDWDYIATDVSEWKEGGNGERMTFVFDRRKVQFKNIAGEIVLSRSSLITDFVEMSNDTGIPQGRQFARTPFLVSFQSGWFKFDICTVHIYFGSESGNKLKRRIEEIKGIAKEISKRASISLEEKKSMLLLGDFNIVHPDHKTMEALKKEGFSIPKTLVKPSNINKDKFYDQIAIKTKDNKLIKFIEKDDDQTKNSGIFEIFKKVMASSAWNDYKEEMKKTTQGSQLNTDSEFKKYFKTWKTYHISDHKPMWIRIPIDKSQSYIKKMSN